MHPSSQTRIQPAMLPAWTPQHGHLSNCLLLTCRSAAQISLRHKSSTASSMTIWLDMAARANVMRLPNSLRTILATTGRRCYACRLAVLRSPLPAAVLISFKARGSFCCCPAVLPAEGGCYTARIAAGYRTGFCWGLVSCWQSQSLVITCMYCHIEGQKPAHGDQRPTTCSVPTGDLLF